MVMCTKRKKAAKQSVLISQLADWVLALYFAAV